MAAEWIFDGVPPSGARHGGLAQAEVFDKNVDTFVREVLQNARDQKRPDADSVRVVLHLEELEGPGLVEFLQFLNWQQLEPHLESIAGAGYVTISPRVAEALELVRSTGKLRILRIDDFGTNGLTGEEDDDDSNFNALCRHTLITAALRRESGGSFGLGKSVLWRFSGLSTVLFSSYPSDRPESLRFFGRTLLAWHSAGGEDWEGSGWLGEPQARLNGRRAVSMWNEHARPIVEGTRLSRASGETGTSILVLGFDDPARETERPVPELCEEIHDSAARWFWPAISNSRMEIAVEGFDQTGQLFARQVRPTREVRPFLEAQTAAIASTNRVTDPGDVAERIVRLDVPPQRPEAAATPHAAMSAEARLRLRLGETGEVDHLNTVAFQRGTGMVVSYWEPPRLVVADQQFHATLVVGTAHGASAADHAAEEFLRASEPVAHMEWTWTTDRLRAEYAWGAQTNLRQFLEAISAALREMLREPATDTSEGPQALRRMFPLPSTGGGSVAPEPYRLATPTAYLTPDGWVFGASFGRTAHSDAPWRIRVALLADQESGSPGDALAITALNVDAGNVRGPDPKGAWEITAEPGVTRVRFDGRASGLEGLPPESLRRTRVRLDVRTVVRAEG